MIYCDASLLVALLVTESGSAVAERWLSEQQSSGLVVSVWVGTAVASALAFKHRSAELDDAGHAVASASRHRLLRSFSFVPVLPRHFIAAGEQFVSAWPAGLRAGDALHLAIVVDNDFGLATLDRKFAEAARRCGVMVETIDPS